MEKTETNKYVIGITAGDINGVGYEIIMKTLADNRIYDDCTIVIYGSPKVAGYHRKALNTPNINLNVVKDMADLQPNRVNMFNVSDENVKVELGKSTVIAGQCSASALNYAVKDLQNGNIDILVTAPINKNNINEAGFNFPGHTEFLAESFGVDDVLMFMVSDELKIGVVTGHVPVNKVSENITVEKILQKLRLINSSLSVDFVIRKPRIAVLGLNPHSGDNGVIGDEEQKVIIPALGEAEKEGITCFGPYPADGFFAAGLYKNFDAVLAMYHDQGLIPFKVIAGAKGVNFTAGLPIVRTSPDHGTAYDIAGKNIADETSFREALYTAVQVWKNRQLVEGIEPLKRYAAHEADKKIC